MKKRERILKGMGKGWVKAIEVHNDLFTGYPDTTRHEMDAMVRDGLLSKRKVSAVTSNRKLTEYRIA